MDLGFHNKAGLVDQQVLESLCLHLPSGHVGFEICSAVLSFFHGCWGSQLLVVSAHLPMKPSPPLPLRTSSVPHHTCWKGAAGPKVLLPSMEHLSQLKKGPAGRVSECSLSSSEPRVGDTPQLKGHQTEHRTMENFLNTNVDQDSKLEKYFLMAENFPNVAQTPPINL